MSLSPERSALLDGHRLQTRAHSWTGFLIGLTIFSAILGTAAFLGTRYLHARPANLESHTRQLSKTLEHVLIANDVAQADIEQSMSEPAADDKAHWTRTSYAVRKLPTGKMNTLIARIQQHFTPLNVTVIDETAGSERVLKLASDGRVFATLNLAEAREDLSETFRQIADQIGANLQSFGIAKDSIHRTEIQQQDETRHWIVTAFEAPEPEWTPSDDVIGRLTTDLKTKGAWVLPQIASRGVCSLRVKLQDLTCATILLTSETETGWDWLWSDPWTGLVPDLKLEHTLPLPEGLPLDSLGLDEKILNRKLKGGEPPHDERPRVAIIVDDGGYGGPTTEAVLVLDTHLTLAIMPGGTHATETARRANERGFEVILHLPMEHELGPEWLNMNMSQEEIRKRTEDAIARVPGIVGINNHMGSLFTANQTAVDRFINVVKDKPYYYVDSRTTGKSKILDAARAAGIRATSRDVFLDNEKNADYIRKQFQQLIKIAQRRGQAVGICHFRKLTVQLLPELLEELPKNGIKLVHASELVR